MTFGMPRFHRTPKSQHSNIWGGRVQQERCRRALPCMNQNPPRPRPPPLKKKGPREIPRSLEKRRRKECSVIPMPILNPIPPHTEQRITSSHYQRHLLEVNLKPNTIQDRYNQKGDDANYCGGFGTLESHLAILHQDDCSSPPEDASLSKSRSGAFSIPRSTSSDSQKYKTGPSCLNANWFTEEP